MRKFISTLFLSLISIVTFADEGMWLPSLISQRIVDMQSKGFKLSAEDIYSVNQASLKDAVVLFDRGCTGELISSQGLLLTNHHCGYDFIQSHSSVQHDYLKDGFWAMTLAEELPNRNIRVDFLDRMEDVTDRVLLGSNEGMSAEQRDSVIRANTKAILKEAVSQDKSLNASVEALYYGNQYFLFVFRVFTDVRLVGAPPSSIGKFGGDTDNWMWPRHTGDFSLFRIYADKDNQPADYSPDNVPYVPKRFFKISTKGVKEGDFTFVYGFPGSTREYITSDAVRYISQRSNPHKIALRTARLEAQRKYMSMDQEVRIKYSAKNASVANAWKKWQGEMKGIDKMKTVEKKEEYEQNFRQWAKGGKYDGLLEKLDTLYSELDEYAFARDYYNESVNSIELPRFAAGLVTRLRNTKDFSDTAKLVSMIENFYHDYYLPIDRECFVALIKAYDANVPDKFKPAYFYDMMKQYGTAEKWAEDFYGKTVFAHHDALMLLCKDWTKAAEMLEKDPAVVFATSFSEVLFNKITPVYTKLNQKINLAYRDYMRGQMEFEKDKVFYPDANLTLRVAYGNVKGYRPADGIYYYPSSTIEGIMQKDNPNIFDYNIPQKLRDIYRLKNYGRWAINTSKDSKSPNYTLPVCFLATNHTTGGNSGSPVINADGELIGINFDRVWEGTMSDVVYDPEVCRNISLDVRYILFIIDKVAGAERLLQEMGI